MRGEGEGGGLAPAAQEARQAAVDRGDEEEEDWQDESFEEEVLFGAVAVSEPEPEPDPSPRGAATGAADHP